MMLGRKIGTTQVIKEDGTVIPVTAVSAGPCFVVDIRTKEKNGYSAICLGYEDTKKANKPLLGYFKKQRISPKKYIMEFREDDPSSYEIGQKIGVDIFKEGDIVKVTGTSKGKGFQGVVKRHGFSGGFATHGSMFGRVIGSSGQSSFPSRVWKNTGMPGRMGGYKTTVKNLKVVKVVSEKNLILIKGAVPGPPKGLVVIKKIQSLKSKVQN
ncbi:TPA: 50S ribosomal protein L3 [bacterium]|nr:50S ribosomal protein L3 [bacterium]